MTATDEIKFHFITWAIKERFAVADARKGQVLQPQFLPRAMGLAEIKQELRPSVVMADDILATIESDLFSQNRGAGGIFFLEDRVAHVFFCNGGWVVNGEYTVESSTDWCKGSRVFSRK